MRELTNKEQLFTDKLIWSRTYYASSVFPESLGRIKGYIKNQQRHHQRIKPVEEWLKLLEKEQ